MTVAIMRTKAEQAFLDSFETVAKELPGSGWVAKLRRDALADFARQGLPGRRVEAYKYTDLRERVKLTSAPLAEHLRAESNRLYAEPSDSSDAASITFLNGRFHKSRFGETAGHGRDFHFDPLAKVIGADPPAWLHAHFADAAQRQPSAIAALNTAHMSDGVVMRIEPGAHLATPVAWSFVSTSEQPLATAVRNLVRVGAGARVTLIETHFGPNSGTRLANAVTDLVIEDGAEVEHIQHIQAGAAATHLGITNVTLGAGATYRAVGLTLDTALARHDVNVTFAGPGAKLDLAGLVLGRRAEHIDQTLVIDHAVPGCHSRELFKCVLDGRARGIVQGKVIVRPGAQKTDGKQMAQALMLSPDAEFDSKPELEIYADDVVCGHGSTCAEIDAGMIFYLMARGIPRPAARALLIESFIGEALDKVRDENLRNSLIAIAHAWLRAAENGGT